MRYLAHMISNLWLTFWGAVIVLGLLVVYPAFVITVLVLIAAAMAFVIFRDAHRKNRLQSEFENHHSERYGTEPRPWVGASNHRQYV